MTIVMVEGYQCSAQRYKGTPHRGKAYVCVGAMEPDGDILVCNQCGRIALREDRVEALVTRRAKPR